MALDFAGGLRAARVAAQRRRATAAAAASAAGSSAAAVGLVAVPRLPSPASTPGAPNYRWE